MANTAVRLLRRIKTDAGWRHYPAVIARNGRVKPGWVTIGDEEVEVAGGYYEMRTYVGSRMVYERLGTDAVRAWAACKKKQTDLSVRKDAKDAGIALAEPTNKIDLTAELERFIKDAEDRNSLVAAKAYRFSLEEFLRVAGRTYAVEIKPDDLLRYQRELRNRGMSARTIANRHAHVLSFLKCCQLDTKLLAPIRPKYEKTIAKAYAPEEMRQLFDAISDEKLHNTFSILLQAGLREQEAVYLPWTSVGFDDCVIQVRSQPAYGFAIKDKEERDVPVSTELITRLKAYRARHPHHTLVTGTRSDLPNRKLLRTLKRIVYKSGIACGTCEGCRGKNHECGKWYLHKFRATAITTWHRAGMDMRTIMRLSGHSDLETVMRYLAPSANPAIQKQVQGINWM